MRKLLFIILTIICLSAAGCSGGHELPQLPLCRVVSEITIQENKGTESRLFHYNDPKAMSKILNYIRHLELWDPAASDADPAGDFGYTITLHLSDGTQKDYTQSGLTRFRAPGDVWCQIPPEHGIRLPLLVEAIK